MTTYCGTPATLRLETLDSTGAVTASLDLMDQGNGYRVDSLDVAFPTVREVVAALPTRDGEYDMTRLYGPRAVTVTGSLIPVASGSRQKALQALAWWCQPRLRPRLVYAVDADCAPMWIGVRGSQLSAPYSDRQVSAFTVSWVATDPVARVLTTSNITINAAGSGTATNHGTYRAWPLIDVYGPCTQAHVAWTTPAAGGVSFLPGYAIASGHVVNIDTQAQTCLLDGTTSVYSSLDFVNTRWPALEPGNQLITFTAATYASPSRIVVTWADSAI
jgi:hypothetical protein